MMPATAASSKNLDGNASPFSPRTNGRSNTADGSSQKSVVPATTRRRGFTVCVANDTTAEDTPTFDKSEDPALKAEAVEVDPHLPEDDDTDEDTGYIYHFKGSGDDDTDDAYAADSKKDTQKSKDRIEDEVSIPKHAAHDVADAGEVVVKSNPEVCTEESVEDEIHNLELAAHDKVDAGEAVVPSNFNIYTQEGVEDQLPTLSHATHRPNPKAIEAAEPPSASPSKPSPPTNSKRNKKKKAKAKAKKAQKAKTLPWPQLMQKAFNDGDGRGELTVEYEGGKMIRSFDKWPSLLDEYVLYTNGQRMRIGGRRDGSDDKYALSDIDVVAQCESESEDGGEGVAQASATDVDDINEGEPAPRIDAALKSAASSPKMSPNPSQLVNIDNIDSRRNTNSQSPVIHTGAEEGESTPRNNVDMMQANEPSSQNDSRKSGDLELIDVEKVNDDTSDAEPPHPVSDRKSPAQLLPIPILKPSPPESQKHLHPAKKPPHASPPVGQNEKTVKDADIVLLGHKADRLRRLKLTKNIKMDPQDTDINPYLPSERPSEEIEVDFDSDSVDTVIPYLASENTTDEEADLIHPPKTELDPALSTHKIPRLDAAHVSDEEAEYNYNYEDGIDDWHRDVAILDTKCEAAIREHEQNQTEMAAVIARYDETIAMQKAIADNAEKKQEDIQSKLAESNTEIDLKEAKIKASEEAILGEQTRNGLIRAETKAVRKDLLEASPDARFEDEESRLFPKEEDEVIDGISNDDTDKNTSSLSSTTREPTSLFENSLRNPLQDQDEDQTQEGDEAREVTALSASLMPSLVPVKSDDEVEYYYYTDSEIEEEEAPRQKRQRMHEQESKQMPQRRHVRKPKPGDAGRPSMRLASLLYHMDVVPGGIPVRRGDEAVNREEEQDEEGIEEKGEESKPAPSLSPSSSTRLTLAAPLSSTIPSKSCYSIVNREESKRELADLEASMSLHIEQARVSSSSPPLVSSSERSMDQQACDEETEINQQSQGSIPSTSRPVSPTSHPSPLGNFIQRGWARYLAACHHEPAEEEPIAPRSSLLQPFVKRGLRAYIDARYHGDEDANNWKD